MDDSAIRRYWDGNARAWTKLVRAGYDVCRDYQTSPAFFELLPDVSGLRGLDIGCGEGHNTRLLAARGAYVTALDISAEFIRESAAHPGSGSVRYLVASALHPPFAAASFDFATAFMSLMDFGDRRPCSLESCESCGRAASSNSRSCTHASRRRIAAW
jgi:SAM-dependent methyltransferase